MVVRSALTLKLLTYSPTGAVDRRADDLAAGEIGGERNWDYRYTWLRDATFTLYALGILGYGAEAVAFKDWVVRSWADPTGPPIQIYVCSRRRARPDGGDAGPPGGLSRLATRADRQRGGAISGSSMSTARCSTRPISSASSAGGISTPTLGTDAARRRTDLRALARARSRHLGGARRTAALHPLEGDVLGRARSSDQGGRGAGLCGRSAALARGARRDSSGGPRTGYNPVVGAFTQAFDSDVLDASVLLLPAGRLHRRA